jgi:AcrR family transcriptional regulator
MGRRDTTKQTRTGAARTQQATHRGGAGSSRLGKTYKAGRVTRESIVRAAEAVLIKDGHASFSIERVAAKIGISRGNLTYYFPTKASLLETLIIYTLARYRQRVRGAGKQLNTGTRAALGDVLTWLMQDASSEHTTRLFRELWAIALHDSRVAQAMDSFYARSVSAHLRRVLDTSRTTRDRQDLEAIIYLMHVMSEGVTVIFGTRRGADRLLHRVQDAARLAIMHLLTRELDVDEVTPGTG